MLRNSFCQQLQLLLLLTTGSQLLNAVRTCRAPSGQSCVRACDRVLKVKACTSCLTNCSANVGLKSGQTCCYCFEHAYTVSFYKHCCRVCITTPTLAAITTKPWTTTAAAAVTTSTTVRETPVKSTKTSGKETTTYHSTARTTPISTSGKENTAYYSTSRTTVTAPISTSSNVSGAASEPSTSTIWILVGVCAALGLLLLVAILIIVLLVLRMRRLPPFRRHNDESTDSPYQSADPTNSDVHPYSTVQTTKKPGETVDAGVRDNGNHATNSSRPIVGYEEAEAVHAVPSHPAAAAVPVYTKPDKTRPGTLDRTDEDYGTTLVDNALYGSRS